MFCVEVGTETTHLCVAEICGNERYLARDWAHHQPTLYVAIDEDTSTERFLAEDWLATAALADVVCGQVDLIEKLRDIARRGAPSTLANVSIPVYRTGPPLIGSQTRPTIPPANDPSGGSPQVAPSHSTAPRPDGVYPPKHIVYRGVEHECELTAKEFAFLEVALLNAETDIGALMHGGQGAVWREPYLATTEKRNKVSGLIARLNSKLLEAKPRLRISFGLRRGQAFIYRQEYLYGDGVAAQ